MHADEDAVDLYRRRVRRLWSVVDIGFGILVPLGCFVADQHFRIVASGPTALLQGPSQLWFKGAVGLGMVGMLLFLWQLGRSDRIGHLLAPLVLHGLFLSYGLTWVLGTVGVVGMMRGEPLGLFGICPLLTAIVFTQAYSEVCRVHDRSWAHNILDVGTVIALNGLLLAAARIAL